MDFVSEEAPAETVSEITDSEKPIKYCAVGGCKSELTDEFVTCALMGCGSVTCPKHTMVFGETKYCSLLCKKRMERGTLSSVGAPSSSGASLVRPVSEPALVPDPADARPSQSSLEYGDSEKPNPSPFDPYPAESTAPTETDPQGTDMSEISNESSSQIIFLESSSSSSNSSSSSRSRSSSSSSSRNSK